MVSKTESTITGKKAVSFVTRNSVLIINRLTTIYGPNGFVFVAVYFVTEGRPYFSYNYFCNSINKDKKRL